MFFLELLLLSSAHFTNFPATQLLTIKALYNLASPYLTDISTPLVGGGTQDVFPNELLVPLIYRYISQLLNGFLHTLWTHQTECLIVTLILTRLSSSSFLPQQNFSLPQSKVKQSMPPGVFKNDQLSFLSDITDRSSFILQNKP